MIVHCIVAVFLSLIGAGKEEPFSTSIRKIRGMYDAEAATVVWQAALRDGLKLGPDDRRGFFEVYSTHSLSSSRLEDDRYFFDDDGNDAIGLYITAGNIPGGVFSGKDVILLSEKGEWVRYPTRTLHYLALGRRIERPVVVSRESADEGNVQFDLGSILGYAIGDAPLSLSWNRPTGTLVARKGDGTVASLTVRTPNDQRSFGTTVGDLTLRSPMDRWVCHRCFIVDVDSPLRLHLPPMDELCRRLDAADHRNDKGDVPTLREYSAEASKAAYALHRMAGQLACVDKRPVSDPQFSTLIHENLQYLNAVAVQHYSPAVKAGFRFAKRDQFAQELANELEIAARCIESSIAGNDGLIDDPNLRWLGLEQTVFSRNADMLYSFPIQLVLSSPDTPLSLKAKVAVAIADMGAPDWSPIKDVPFEIPGREADFLKAIFHACWNRPPFPEEINVCLSKLPDEFAGLDVKAAAIDCLLRWGRFRDVPADQAEVWFRFRLKGSTRHSMLKALSLQPEGRAFLLERFERLQAEPDIFQQIASILRQRATATMELNRFDFMSEEECRAILAKWK